MDSLNLFWSLNVNNSTKLIMISIVVILILCIICKPKNKKKVDEYINHSNNKNNNKNNNLSKCQIDYETCKENNRRGNIDKTFCHVCKPNGDYPDKIYHPNVGWMKVDPKTGKESA